MKLLELNINKCLLLEKFNFTNPYNNIDWLNAKAIATENLEEKLKLLNLAASQLEKFHSFFHFEQSFFHLQLAIKYLELGKEEEADIQLEAAIFQDHVNGQAISLKQTQSLRHVEQSETSKGCFRDPSLTLEDDDLPLVDSHQVYKRVYNSFAQYLKFASGEDFTEEYDEESYWAFKQDLYGIENIIEEIKKLHLAYHQESAKLYLNRAIIFKKIGNNELAKNDLTKAHNLDSALNEKSYYESSIEQIGTKVALGLGSNLGDREKYLQLAIAKLQDLRVLFNIELSVIEETKALLLPDSPKEWDLNYLNMVVVGVTILSPEALLKAIKNIEQMLGRKDANTWAPREIDIDILLYEEEIIELEHLTIPHSELCSRPWVLKALADICPDWVHPKQKIKIKDLI